MYIIVNAIHICCVILNEILNKISAIKVGISHIYYTCINVQLLYMGDEAILLPNSIMS